MNRSFPLHGRRLLAALGLAAVLSGCTTIVGDPLKAPATADQSPVVISITSNTGQIRGFDQVQLGRIATPDAAGGTFLLQRLAPGMARDTALFAGNLPAGEYEFEQFIDNHTRKSLWIRDKQRAQLGRLTVQAGTPVDLGRLIITPLNEKVLFGRSRKVADNRDLLRRFSPDHLRLFSGATAQGWTGAPPAEDKVEDYALAHPVGADCMTELDDGRVVAASRMGTVLQRTKAGRWSALRSPGIESLLCVTPVQLPNADLLAVGEFGALLRHAPGTDKLVQIDTGDLPPGNLVRIAGNAQAGWYVAHQDKDTVTVFHSARLETGNWTPVARESVAWSAWSGGTAFWMWPTANGFAYTASGGPLRFFDYATRQWTERDLPGKRRLTELRVGSGSQLSVLTSPGGGIGGIFGSTEVSNDEGRTWTTIEGPYKVKISPVVQLPDGGMLMYGGALGQAELQASKDGGKTWTRQADYLHGNVMQVMKSGQLFDADQGQFGFFTLRTSSDGGRTWTAEYSTFDQAFYQSQQAAKAAK